MRIFTLIITIALLLPLSVDCQEDSAWVSVKLLATVANKLDSFDVLKQKEVKLLAYATECDSMVSQQKYIIGAQDYAMFNMTKQMEIMADIEAEYKKGLIVNTDYIKKLEKQNKGAKIRNKVYLIGGVVVSVGLATGLLISLTQ